MASQAQDTGEPGRGTLGDLETKYANVSLVDEEDVGLESLETEAEKESGAGVDLRWAAVGRFLTDKSIKIQVMRQVLDSIWRPVKGVRIKAIEDNRFIFQFFHEKDMQRIIGEGPWAFENATLVLKRLGDGDQPMNILLDRVEYWIQVHDVSCGFLTEQIAEQIGNSIGTFVQNDSNNFGGN